MPTYKVKRFYQNPNKPAHTVRGMTGMILEQVQFHCDSSEASSRTCKDRNKKRITYKYGAWFEGWTEEK